MQTKEKKTPLLPDLLPYLYKPFLPTLKKIKINREGPRDYNPEDILLPDGYVAEVVASGFNAPVHCCFDEQGNCYVIESGHKIDAAPRIMKVDPNSGEQEVFFTLPEDRWVKGSAMTGACWHQGSLFVMNTDTLLRIDANGSMEEIVTGLPGRGDHQANHPIAGPDGKIYFGQGCATNCGVVGSDNFGFEWLDKNPQVCDVPAQDIVLAGQNYESRDILGNERDKVLTGAFVPYRTPTHPGQVIKGNVKASGAILRCNPDGTGLEVYAWGLRNPYGLAFSSDGRLFATEHGMDERGERYIVGDPDDFYEVRRDEWYGWPDFASGIRLDDPYWGKDGLRREPVLAQFPNPLPLRPLASFESHVAANGFDFSRSPEFGFEGQAFVACFGDLAPITTLKKGAEPHGFKVMRVDTKTGQVLDFAVNKYTGPASKLPHSGFERPSHCQFGPDGSLYIVDFGIIHLAPELGGIRQQIGSGSLWRIRRSGSIRGVLPPEPLKVPLYLMQGIALAIGLVGVGALSLWAVKKLTDGRKRA